MKVTVNVTVTKNDNGTYNARCKTNTGNGSQENLKGVSLKEVTDYVGELLKVADDAGLIDKR